MRTLAAAALGAGFVYGLFLWERRTFVMRLLDPGKPVGPPEPSYILRSVNGRGVRTPLTASTATTKEWDA